MLKSCFCRRSAARITSAETMYTPRPMRVDSVSSRRKAWCARNSRMTLAPPRHDRGAVPEPRAERTEERARRNAVPAEGGAQGQQRHPGQIVVRRGSRNPPAVEDGVRVV